MIGRRGPRPVVIDTDVGIDDTLAIVLALRSRELRVELVTTVAGNAGLRAATDNARRVLALLDPAEPPRLVAGAARPLRGRSPTAARVHGDDGLAGLSRVRDSRGRLLFPASRGPLPAREGAASAIVAKAREHGGALTVVALGPLTNLARALDTDSSAMRAVGRLIVMGGAVEAPGNMTAAAEFNFHFDPEAADRVLTSGMRITLVGLDVTRRVRLRWPVVRDALGGNESPRALAIRHLTRPADTNDDGLLLHDPLAMAVAVVALIAVDAAGHNQIAVASGANSRLRPAHLREGLRRVHMGSVVIAQLEVPLDTVEAAFRAARRAGATTMLNPAPVPSSAGKARATALTRSAPNEAPLVGLLPQTLVTLTDVVVVNRIEAEQLAGLSVTGIVHARRAAAVLIEGGFGAAVVTLGDRGAVWTDAAGGGRAAAPRVKAIDTVGAGDTFVGYLASGLARGAALGDSVTEAVHAAALAVTRRGAQSGIPRRAEVARSVSAGTRSPGS